MIRHPHVLSCRLLLTHNSSHSQFVFPTPSVVIFFLAAFTSVFAILVTILKKLFSILAVQLNQIYTYDIKVFDDSMIYEVIKNLNGISLIIYILSFIFALIFSFTLLPYIIIHVKNSSKVHQEYYIRKIVALLRRNKKLLIIEDVDRLDEIAQENVFRIASCINKACGNINHYVGIISFEKYRLKVDYNVLENKVLDRNVLENYNEERSKYKFLVEYLNLIIGCYLWEQKKNIGISWNRYAVDYLIRQYYPHYYDYLKNLTIDEDNFRSIHSYIEEMIDLVKGEVTETDLLNIVKKVK